MKLDIQSKWNLCYELLQSNNNNNNKIKESTYCSSVLHTVLHTHIFLGEVFRV